MVLYVESRHDDDNHDDNETQLHCNAINSISSNSTSLRDAKQLAEEQWNRAAAVLSARPSLLTPKIFFLVLKNRPPAHVVKFLLSINPHAADIPKQGPTPLQVAVRHNASLEVIKTLLKACPLALVATHAGYDPLMYAKIWRREEPELLHLLSKPLSSLMAEAVKEQRSQTTMPSSSTPSSSSSSSSVLVVPRHAAPRTGATTPTFPSMSDDHQELENIKMIASTIVRAQKRQAQAMQHHKQQVESSLDQYQEWNMKERTNQLRELERRQTDHFRAQLIALDMKERAMLSKVRTMERRVVQAMERTKEVRSHREARQQATIQRLETTVRTMYGVMQDWQGQAEQRISNAELRLEQECRMNDYFRSDTRLQLDQFEHRAKHHDNDDEESMTPIVYATPYTEKDVEDGMSEEEPLFAMSYGTKAPRKRYPGRNRKRRSPLSLLHF